MIIKNKTRHILLANNAIEAKSILTQTLGLMVHRIPIAHVFRTRFGIHTFFLRYPIDILILDKTNHVVAVSPNLKPFRIFIWNPKYPLVIELPAGTINQTKTSIGDQLLLRH